MRGFLLGAVLLLVLPTFAGCLGDGKGVTQVTVAGRVVDRATDAPLEGVRVVLESQDGRRDDATDGDGAFSFRVPATAACRLETQAAGRVQASVGLDCRGDRAVTLRVAALAVPDAPGAPGGGAGLVTLSGTVRNAATDAPVANAELHLAGDGTQHAGRSGGDGAYLLRVAPGDYALHARAPCHALLQQALPLDADLQLDLFLADDGQAPALGAPTGLRAVPGPGPGQATLVWQAPGDAGSTGVRGYEVLRDGDPVATLPNTRAHSVHAAGSYAVRALGCGPGEASEAVAATPLPGAPREVGTAPLSVEVSEDAFEVLAPDGTSLGTRPFRVVQGTGNCCENYVATDAAGRIYDFGGTFLQVSEDDGATWRTVATPIPYLTGEGAVTVAPNGDVVGIGWSPYTGDQLWAHKYVAAEDRWTYAPSPIHTPFYDRPWLAVVEGPFEQGGLVVPYATYAISNFGSLVMYVSLDGLHYALAEQNDLSALTGGPVAWPGQPAADPGRDWSQPHQAARLTTIDEGHGVREGTTACSWVGVGPDLRWGCSPASATLPTGHLVVDSNRAFHVFDADGRDVAYHHSVDGVAWTTRTVRLPAGAAVEEWDAKVNGALGVAVVAVHAHVGDADQDFLVRFTGVGTDPQHAETVRVGTEAADSDSGVAGERRFDFATVGLLPDGRFVMSFTDADRHPPALAVEMR